MCVLCVVCVRVKVVVFFLVVFVSCLCCGSCRFPVSVIVCACVCVCVLTFWWHCFNACSFFIICHEHAVRRRCMPTDRSNGNLQKMKLFFVQRTRLPPHKNRTQKKRPIFDHRLCFSVWSRLKSHDPISLKPHAGSPHGHETVQRRKSPAGCWKLRDSTRKCQQRKGNSKR